MYKNNLLTLILLLIILLFTNILINYISYKNQNIKETFMSFYYKNSRKFFDQTDDIIYVDLVSKINILNNYKDEISNNIESNDVIITNNIKNLRCKLLDLGKNTKEEINNLSDNQINNLALNLNLNSEEFDELTTLEKKKYMKDYIGLSDVNNNDLQSEGCLSGEGYLSEGLEDNIQHKIHTLYSNIYDKQNKIDKKLKQYEIIEHYEVY
tara:strand:- start:484 stop:1113 length:630 start_codon:yes stop_codon:yes gene_type:complete